MRDFRPCPSCDGGGGFLSFSCIAASRAKLRAYAYCVGLGLVMAVAFGGTAHIFSRAVDAHLSLSNSVAAGGLGVLTRKIAQLAHQVASAAAPDSPMVVGCPDCQASFSLAAADAAADAASGGSTTRGGALPGDEAWVREHTRPCPRCAAPILKSGGCNAMVCSRCRLHFCWACMRPRRQCTHFKCANGAPHGNASPWDDLRGADGEALTRAGERAAMAAHAGATVVQVSSLGGIVLHVAAVLGQRATASSVARFADAVAALPLHFAMSIVDLICTVGVTVLCTALGMLLIAQAQQR